MRRFRPPLELGVFVQVPAIAFLWLVWFVYGHGGGGDFAIFRRAGRAVLHGHSPYVHPTLKLLAANDRFVYPTPFALPFIPFAAAPEKAAQASGNGGGVVAPPGTTGKRGLTYQAVQPGGAAALKPDQALRLEAVPRPLRAAILGRYSLAPPLRETFGAIDPHQGPNRR